MHPGSGVVMRYHMRGFTLRLVPAVFVTSFLLLSEFSVGQAVYGNIIGTVSDASGAAVPNAAITITEHICCLAVTRSVSVRQDSAYLSPQPTFRSIPQLA